MRKTRTVLSAVEGRKLGDLLLSKWAEIETAKPSRNVFAQDAAKQLGFELNASHVARACQSIERRWPGARIENGQIAVIAANLADLFRELGKSVPPELAAIVESK